MRQLGADMSDETPRLSKGRPEAPTGPGAGAGPPEPALAYDYFKSMVSVSVATLGGILTLGETVFGARLSPLQIAFAASPMALSGLLALQGQTDITQVLQGLKPPLNSSKLALRLVPSLYGLGIGIFLAFLALSYLAPELAAKFR